MGLMTGSGCLSRFMGPVFVTYVYTRLGTVWTFGITTAIMVASMAWLLLFQRRLIVPEEQAGQRLSAKGLNGEDADADGKQEKNDDDDRDEADDEPAVPEAVRLQEVKTEKG